MRILDINIDGFGKLVGFSVQACAGFNLVFGLNESGKSTFQAFVKAVLFGIDEYEIQKFKPWFSDTYAGSVTYALDNGAVYSLHRDFNTGKTTVKNDRGEVISEDGRFFMKQTEADPEIYSASAYMEQTRLKFGDEIKQYLNKYVKDMYDPVFSEVSLDETLELLSRYSGSDEGRMLENEISEISIKIRELKENSTGADIRLLEKKHDIVSRNHEDIKRLKAKAAGNASGRIDAEVINRLAELKNKMMSIKERKNRLIIPFFILCFGAIALGIYSFISEREDLHIVALGILLLSFLILLTDGLMIFSRSRKLKAITLEAEELTRDNSLPSDISLSELISIRNRTVDNYDEDIDETIALKYAAIKLNADKELKTYEDIPEYLYELEKRIERYKNNDNAESSMKKDRQIEQLEEKLEQLEERHREAVKTGRMFEAAMESVRSAGKDTGKDYRTVFTGTFPEMMKAVTAGKYNEIGTGTSCEQSAKCLSSGTLEQLYLAMRLTAALMIAGKGEKMPLFMDEIFAYSDEKRIVEALKFFGAKADTCQMFYLTCRRTEASMAKTLMGDKINIIRLKV